MKSKSTIQPLFDNVLIKPLEAEQKTASGIILPDSAKEKPQAGIVMAIGTGALSEEYLIGGRVQLRIWIRTLKM